MRENNFSLAFTLKIMTRDAEHESRAPAIIIILCADSSAMSLDDAL
jgi:hypothetical protein